MIRHLARAAMRLLRRRTDGPVHSTPGESSDGRYAKQFLDQFTVYMSGRESDDDRQNRDKTPRGWGEID